jgi:PEP-CTERM motif
MTMKFRQIAIAGAAALCAALAHADSGPGYTTTVINDDTIEFSQITLSETEPTAIRFTLSKDSYPVTFNWGTTGQFSSFGLYDVNDLSTALTPATYNTTAGNLWSFKYDPLDMGTYVASMTGSGTAGLRVAVLTVPEPEALAMALAGLGVAGTLIRRRRAA